jgi:hypothetical protein
LGIELCGYGLHSDSELTKIYRVQIYIREIGVNPRYRVFVSEQTFIAFDKDVKAHLKHLKIKKSVSTSVSGLSAAEKGFVCFFLKVA